MRMTRGRSGSILTALLCALLLGSASEAVADQGLVFFHLGESRQVTDRPCALKRLPSLEGLASVPPIADPLARNQIPVLCQIQVSKRDEPVRNARGSYAGALFVLDHVSGRFDAFEIDSGSFKTGANGSALFEYQIPASIFTDGFESGDVSAWSRTRADFKNKRGDRAALSCDIGVAR
ncbi:MAG: hypothetical protein ACE5GX_12060 [Thermoanaerobaculia bacterium]